MRIGHGSAPLPVPDGTPMAGYAARSEPSSGVLDELAVHCVSLGRLVLVVADVLCVDAELAAAVRRQVTDGVGPVVDVWVCATHTHSGPDLGPAWHPAIAGAAAAAARAAVASERELAGRLHAGSLRGVGSRRDRDGDDQVVGVDVVACVDGEGAPAGVLAVVPIHPTVLPASSTAISGDLASAIRTSLERRLRPHGAPWVVVATGAAGDISTRRTRRAQTPDECRRLGETAAAQLAALLDGPATAIWDAGSGACAAARRTVAMPARHEDERELEAQRRTLAERYERASREGAMATARTLETALQGVDLARARPPVDHVPVPLSAARLGRLAVFGIGGDPFHSFRDELRGRCADEALVLGYVNGHIGYLPDEAAYATLDYEVLASPLPSAAAAATVAALIDLLPDPTED